MFDTAVLKKLDDDTLPGFVAARGLGLVLFGSHNGKPTLAQAHVFADLWADRHRDVRFGYVDALAHEAAKKRYAVRVLPTLLVVRDGRVISKLEGFHDRTRLEAALASRVEALTVQAA
jgi:thioredoxin-like negative regulator of GroEL